MRDIGRYSIVRAEINGGHCTSRELTSGPVCGLEITNS